MFLRCIRDILKRQYGNLDGLRAIYTESPTLGPQLEAYAR